MASGEGDCVDVCLNDKKKRLSELVQRINSYSGFLPNYIDHLKWLIRIAEHTVNNNHENRYGDTPEETLKRRQNNLKEAEEKFEELSELKKQARQLFTEIKTD